MVSPTPPHVAVDSASFFHAGCSHAELFRAEYKRSNRTKGLKILRCFPHCCPEHIDRSYCGSSLSVRVQLTENSTHDKSSDALTVFARFEAVSDVSLRPGECVEVQKIAANTQSDSNLEGQWIAATLDCPSILVTTIRTPGTPTDEQKPLVFHLNSKPFVRWYYDWESGANKAQRLTKHVLKAYILERCAVDANGNFTAVTSRAARTQLYRVAHVVTSPEFTVISYRRAAEQNQTAQQAGRWNGAHAGPSPRGDLFGGVDAYSQPRDSSPPAGSIFRDGNTQQRAATPARQSDSTNSKLEDTLRWEHENQPAVLVSKNLALLYSFLRWAPLSVYASFVDELVHLVHHKLLGSLTADPHELSKLNCFSRVLLGQAEADPGTAVASSNRGASGGAPTVLPFKLERLLRVLSRVTLWFYAKETRQWLHGFFQQYATSVISKNAMRGCFLLFLQELEERLNTQVLEVTQLRNVSAVAEEVIAAVYSYEYFYSRRHLVRQMLGGQSFAGWSAFVAQMRDTYISMSVQPGVPRSLTRQPGLTFSRAHPPRNEVEAHWNAEWLLDVENAEWTPSGQAMKPGDGANYNDRDPAPASLLTLFDVISQIVRLDVAIDVEANELCIRSTQGVAGPLACMRLVLDGKGRAFSLFPNGMTSNATFGACGDYIGEMEVNQEGQLVVFLQIFQWAAQVEGGPSYHMRMRIESLDHRRLCVTGDALATTAPTDFSSNNSSYLGELSLQAKREIVVKPYAQHLQSNHAVSAAPWKEHGKFYMWYSKV